MEVLNINTLLGTAILAFLGWLGINMVDVKTELAVTHEKVANVEEMVKPLWEDYLLEKSGDKYASLHAKAN